MTIEENKMMWKLEVENNKPLYGSFSKEMKRLYNKIVDNGKSNAEPSRADQVNAMCDMLFKKYEEYKKVEHTGGDREVLADNTELSNKTRLCESECTDGTC